MADPDRRRILHEDGNEAHRLRVEHDRARLYVELSGKTEEARGPSWQLTGRHGVTRLLRPRPKTAAAQAAAHPLTELLDQ